MSSKYFVTMCWISIRVSDKKRFKLSQKQQQPPPRLSYTLQAQRTPDAKESIPAEMAVGEFLICSTC